MFTAEANRNNRQNDKKNKDRAKSQVTYSSCRNFVNSNCETTTSRLVPPRSKLHTGNRLQMTTFISFLIHTIVIIPEIRCVKFFHRNGNSIITIPHGNFLEMQTECIFIFDISHIRIIGPNLHQQFLGTGNFQIQIQGIDKRPVAIVFFIIAVKIPYNSTPRRFLFIHSQGTLKMQR